eukprot:2556057-Prorocentrum_lima.AAC.1
MGVPSGKSSGVASARIALSVRKWTVNSMSWPKSKSLSMFQFRDAVVILGFHTNFVKLSLSS